MFLEYYELGDLFRFCQTKKGLMEKEAKFVVRNMIEAIKEVHSKNIVLRDIKPEN